MTWRATTSIVQCELCSWKYPDNLTSNLITPATSIECVCPICALELTNSIHGVHRKEFDGILAEQRRKQSIRWRLDHPEFSPANLKKE